MNNPGKFGDADKALEALNNTRHCLKAFSTMLEMCLHHGSGDPTSDSFGVTSLLDQQLDDLKEIEHSLIDHIKSLQNAPTQKSEPAVNPADRREFQKVLLSRVSAAELSKISNALGLDNDTVYKVIMMAAIPGLGPQASATQTRDAQVAERLKGGVDAGEIAQALNLKTTTVEKVIGQLLAGQPSTDPEEGQQAVNG